MQPGPQSDLRSGVAMFVRYAHPPNERGYCGPDDNAAFMAYGQRSRADPNLSDPAFAKVAQAFTGAWPYLELIAAQTGIGDPLDHGVVEAYWVGNELLDQVDPSALGDSMHDLFRRSLPDAPHAVGATTSAADGSPAMTVFGLPHHSYHVFCVYPWVGLLGNERMRGHALDVLDKCRIRWARVVGVAGGQVEVESRPLTFDGRQLGLGPPRIGTATGPVDTVPELRPGDRVSVHWDWICDHLGDRQLEALQRHTFRHLDMANERLAATVTPGRVV